MLNKYDKFVNFCFTHGGTLRNHKAFGEMSRELRKELIALQVSQWYPICSDELHKSLDRKGFRFCHWCGHKFGSELESENA